MVVVVGGSEAASECRCWCSMSMVVHSLPRSRSYARLIHRSDPSTTLKHRFESTSTRSSPPSLSLTENDNHTRGERVCVSLASRSRSFEAALLGIIS